MAVLVALDGDRVIEQHELDLFGLCVLHLFLTGRQLVLAAAVGDVHMLRAQTLCHAGRVHGHVAAAHDGYAVELLDGRIVIVPVGLHQVHAGEELVCGVHAQQILAGDVQKLGQTSAGADEHGLIAVLEQLVHGQGLADDHVVLDHDAHGLQVFDLGGHDLLGETELGDAVDQNAAGLVESLKNGHFIAHLAQVASAGQARRAGADDGDLVSVGFGHGDGGLVLFGHVVVGHKALQTAYAHALALDASDAFALALLFLGADAAADGGQGVGGGDDVVSGVKVALGHLGDKLGDAHGHRAAGAAQGVLAVEAALCLVYGHLGGIAQGHLVKILVPYQRILLRHGIFLHLHISHCVFLPSFYRCAERPHPARPCRRRRA